MKIFSVID